MTDIASLVAELITAGCAPEVAARVVAAAFTAGIASAPFQVDEVAERRRAWNAEYMRRWRKERKASTPRKPHVNPTPSPIGTRLPDDWSPDDEGNALAFAELGARADQELAKFHDYWKALPGSKGRKLDWNATWRNWIRRKMEGHVNGHKFDNSSDQNSRTSAIIAGVAGAATRRLTKGRSRTVVKQPDPAEEDDTFKF